MPKVIQVIENFEMRGTGKDGDPVRRIYQLLTLDGKLIMEHDPEPTKPKIIEVDSNDPKEIEKIIKFDIRPVIIKLYG